MLSKTKNFLRRTIFILSWTKIFLSRQKDKAKIPHCRCAINHCSQIVAWASKTRAKNRIKPYNILPCHLNDQTYLQGGRKKHPPPKKKVPIILNRPFNQYLLSWYCCFYFKELISAIIISYSYLDFQQSMVLLSLISDCNG